MINCTFYTANRGVWDESICKWDASTVGHNATVMIELEWGKIWTSSLAYWEGVRKLRTGDAGLMKKVQFHGGKVIENANEKWGSTHQHHKETK